MNVVVVIVVVAFGGGGRDEGDVTAVSNKSSLVLTGLIMFARDPRSTGRNASLWLVSKVIGCGLVSRGDGGGLFVLRGRGFLCPLYVLW